MKNSKMFLLALLLIVIATSCTFAQKGESKIKNFPVQSFTSIKCEVVGNIIYTQAGKVSVRAEGDERMIDNLRVTEKNGVLKIVLESRFSNKRKKDLTLYISSPIIELVETESVGNWTMKGNVKADNLKIEMGGVGNFEALDLECSNIKANGEGVGNITLGGTTKFVEIESEGVGSVNAEKLTAKSAIVRSHGVGSVKCYASESIDINNNGVGSVTYYGNPTVKNMMNSGVGKIKAGK